MERFENEYGTLTSLALFFGREGLFPLNTTPIQNTDRSSFDHGPRGIVSCHRVRYFATE